MPPSNPAAAVSSCNIVSPSPYVEERLSMTKELLARDRFVFFSLVV